MTRSLLASLIFTLSLAACVPDYDYEGDYAMTYTVVTNPGAEQPVATAGTTRIDIRKGLADDTYRIDLGPSFCQLTGKLIQTTTVGDVPYLEIAAQPCWHDGAALSLAGTAAWDDDGERLSIVLAGSIDGRAPTTIQFTESW